MLGGTEEKMTQEERMGYIEFRMDLLREGTEFAKFIYDCEVTEEQLRALYDVMDGLRQEIDNGNEVSSAAYETEVLRIVDSRRLDYHFCESFARLLWEEGRYEEAFPALYGESMKFQHLFK